MRKSPGRWIKSLIFGKKSSRSKKSKANDEKIDENQVPVSQDQRTELKTEQNQLTDNLQDNICIPETTEINAQNESDRIREEQAAIDLQAAFRGCLARRSFRTLKGIIRLQALIRGHLVRRQSISTLYCMFRIVRFQALVRGRSIRKRCDLKVMCSVCRVNRSMQLLKLSSNGIARKILASSPTPMRLHFHYNSNDANSIENWLERWSTSRCWQLLPKAKSSHPSKPKNPHTRRSSVTKVEIIASKLDKPIRSVRKVSSLESVTCIEENPELILERIKRNLRKVSSTVLHNTNDSTVQNMISEPEKLKVNEAETVVIKKTRRVICAPVKHELIQSNESLSLKRSVPGYMAATISAKAKLKCQDVSENPNTLTRRYSLPSLADVSIPVSPMAKSNGKLKDDRSLQLSRDGNVKVNRAEWRW